MTIIRTPALNALIELVTNPPHGNNLVIQADKKQILLNAMRELIDIVAQLEQSNKSNEDNTIIVTGVNLTIRTLREENDELKRVVAILEKAAKQKTDPPGNLTEWKVPKEKTD